MFFVNVRIQKMDGDSTFTLPGSLLCMHLFFITNHIGFDRMKAIFFHHKIQVYTIRLQFIFVQGNKKKGARSSGDVIECKCRDSEDDSSKKGTKSKPAPPECGICFATIKNGNFCVINSCMHEFCYECIYRWHKSTEGKWVNLFSSLSPRFCSRRSWIIIFTGLFMKKYKPRINLKIIKNQIYATRKFGVVPVNLLRFRSPIPWKITISTISRKFSKGFLVRCPTLYVEHGFRTRNRN